MGGEGYCRYLRAALTVVRASPVQQRDFVHPSPIMSSALPADVLKVANEGNVKLFGKWESTECVLFVGLGRFRGVEEDVVLVIREESVSGREG